MFISKKRLERILEEERQKTQRQVWEEESRAREREKLYERIERLENKVWELYDEVHNGAKWKAARAKKV